MSSAAFLRDLPLRWHLKAALGCALGLYAAYALASDLVFRISLR